MLQVAARRFLPVNKCCPAGEVLKLSEETPKCEKAPGETLAPAWPESLVNNNKDPVHWELTAMLVQDKIGFPACASSLEVHTLKPGIDILN